MAGADFLKRHPHLRLRKPQHTSVARTNGSNAECVNNFFSKLKKLGNDNRILPQNVYNSYKTPVCTVPKGNSEVLALKGQKQVEE